MNRGGEPLYLFPASTFVGVALCVLAGSSPAAETTKKAPMQVNSTAFNEGEPIPAKYTCDGKNVSPPLKWTGAPAETKSIALIADDPDAPVGTWVHWVLYDAPPETKNFPEDLSKGQYLPGGAKQGINDFKHLGYGGPCPPPGKPHRYFFKLYALDKLLAMNPGATKQEIERAMANHILAQAQLIGTYKRK